MFNFKKFITISFFACLLASHSIARKVLFVKIYNFYLNSFIIFVRCSLASHLYLYIKIIRKFIGKTETTIFYFSAYKLQINKTYNLIARYNRHVKQILKFYYYNLTYEIEELLEGKKYDTSISIKRPAFLLNLGLKFRFEMTSKLIIQKISNFNLFLLLFILLFIILMRQKKIKSQRHRQILVIDKKFGYAYKNSNIKNRGKFVIYLPTYWAIASLNMLQNLISVHRHSNKQILLLFILRSTREITLYTKLYKYNRQLKMRLFSKISYKEKLTFDSLKLLKEQIKKNVPYKYQLLNCVFSVSRGFISSINTRLINHLSKSSLPLQFVSLGPEQINKPRALQTVLFPTNNQLLNKYKLLWSYSLTSLKNQPNKNISLITPHSLYSTKTSKFTSDRPRTIKNKKLSPKYNYILGWQNHWLRKYRYIEMLDKYKLDAKDKLFLSILKERKYNLNKKMSQIPHAPRSSGSVGVSTNPLNNNDSESLINNTNLNLIKNKIKKNKNSHSQSHLHSKFSAGGKSRDFLKNQIIQYKFNRSNARPGNLNIVWKGSYLSKQKEIISALSSLFDLCNWPGEEKVSFQDIDLKPNNISLESLDTQNLSRSKFHYLSIFHTLLFSNIFFLPNKNSLLSSVCALPATQLRQSTKINTLKPMTFSATNASQKKESLTIEKLSKDIKVFPQLDESNNLTKLSPKKEAYYAGYVKEGKIDEVKKKELDRLSNVKWKNNSLDHKSFLNEVSFSFINQHKAKAKAKIGFSLGRGVNHIDIISLEKLFKSFFKKMYSLISLPILEYLPDKWNIRLFYYLTKHAKTYYSSTNIINSNLRSIVGINFRLPQPIAFHRAGERINSILNKNKFGIIKKETNGQKPFALGVLGSQGDGISIGASKAHNLYNRTKKGHPNNALRFMLSSTNPHLGASPSSCQLPLVGERLSLGAEIDKNQYLLPTTINKEAPKWTKNQISNNPLAHRYSGETKKLIDEVSKSQLRSRSMQMFSLKYYWSNILNPSLKKQKNKKRDYYTVLDNINNLSRIYYSSHLDALLKNSKPLKFNLFSKWRGENNHIEYKTKLNRTTRLLQNETTIKEAILFSNPLLKEILDSQSLIYPYSIKTNKINERLALFYKKLKPTSKLTFFNKAVKNISRVGASKKPIGLGIWASFFSNIVGKLKIINPWQSIFPIQLNTLKKDLIKNEIFFKNFTLKHIFNKNLCKLNLILFLVRAGTVTSPTPTIGRKGCYVGHRRGGKEFTSLSRQNFNSSHPHISTSTSTSSSISTRNSTFNKLNIQQIFHYNWAEEVVLLHHSIFQPNLELKFYKYTKKLDNLFSVYLYYKNEKISITSEKVRFFPQTYRQLLPLNLPIIRINKNLIFKEVHVDTKVPDSTSFNPNQMFRLIVREKVILPVNITEYLVSPDTDRNINLVLRRKILVTKNISVNYLYTLYKIINVKEDFFVLFKEKEKFFSNTSHACMHRLNAKQSLSLARHSRASAQQINLGDLGLEDSRRKVRNTDPLYYFDKVRSEFIRSTNKLNPKYSNTRTLLGLSKTYESISNFYSVCLLASQSTSLKKNSVKNILNSDYRWTPMEREIDSPNNKESKGLVSYNKILFKKLLVFLKLIFNKEIELDLTRIKNPYNETHILNQILGEVIKHKGSSVKFVKLIKKIRENANIKSKFSLEQDTTAPNPNANPKQMFQLPSILLEPETESLFLSSREELKNSPNRAKKQINMLHIPTIDKDIERERERERERDKHISSYNLIALDKWSNLNKLDKHDIIYNYIAEDLKGIGFDNQLFNDRNIDKDKSKYKDSNIVEGIITDKKEGVLGQEINYTNWRNLRNNFSLLPLLPIGRRLKNKNIGITSEIAKDKITNTHVSIASRTSNTNNDSKYILNNEIPSNLSATLSIDYKSEALWGKIKINKLMTYKMLAPLITNSSINKLIDLSAAGPCWSSKARKPDGFSLSLNKNTNNINKNSNSIWINRKILSYPSTPTPLSIPLSINSPVQLRDTRGGIVANREKVNLVHSNISGIKLKLGGRLEKALIVPRRSSQEVLIGNMSRGSTTFKNTSRLTYKNKRGAYSITVSASYLSHKCRSLPITTRKISSS